MNALEILLGRRWILKSRDRELYYQVKDQLGAVKRFLTEKLGYQVIVNPYLIKAEKMPAKPENWMGILEFHHKIEYVFFCIVLMFLEEKEAAESLPPPPYDHGDVPGSGDGRGLCLCEKLQKYDPGGVVGVSGL